jgi:hypothetical protein
LAGESLNDLEDKKMESVHCMPIQASFLMQSRYSIHHRIPLVFIGEEGMRKDEIDGTQNLFAIFKGYRCGFVGRDAP